jgi:hypothetical protein
MLSLAGEFLVAGELLRRNMTAAVGVILKSKER